MQTWLIALIVAASAGTWIYVKMSRRTGSGNVGSAAIAAGASGLVIFIIVFTLLQMLGL